MRKFFKMALVLLITIPVLTGCPPPPPEPEFTLNVSMDPDNDDVAEILIVPDKPEYEEDDKVTIQANPKGDWQFQKWSGSGISSTENPLSLTMDQNYSITANFSNGDPPAFSVDLSITDGVHSRTVKLVSDDDAAAQNGLDSKDREGPPLAPPGAFFTGSVVDGMHLYKDVRQAAGNIVWELRLHRASGETITLEDWFISKTDIGGSLILVDDPNDPTPNIELDMQSASSFSVSDPSIQRLYVVYEQDASSKVITDMPTMGKELEIQEKADPSMDRLKEGVRNANEPNQLHQKNQ